MNTMTPPTANLHKSNRIGPASVIGIALMLCAAWMLVWRGSLDGVFHFDDYSSIVDNEGIRKLWPLDDFLRSSRPIGLYSFAVNYHFSGETPYAYHVTNLVIHLVNGLLLFAGCYLTGRMSNGRVFRADGADSEATAADNGQARLILVSGLIASLWVVHPLTTQAVTNIVQRYESLSSLGYLGAWVGLLIYLRGFRWLGCSLILPAAWIGLMSKEVFATAPLVILLFDRLISQQTWFSIAKLRWLPYMLMVSPYVWFIPTVAFFFDPVRTQSSSAGLGMETISPWEYLRTQPEVLWHYLGLVVWPNDLCFDYLWKIQSNPWIYLPLGASIVFVLLLGIAAYVRGLRSIVSSTDGVLPVGLSSIGMAGWLVLTFFLILSPTSSFMPIADIAVEHRMYLASSVVVAGLVLGATAIAGFLLRQSERPLVLKAGLACIVLFCLAMLSWRTHLRNQDYRDGIVLWRTAARISPENPRAWYNMGQEYYQRGDRDAALRPMISAVGFSGSSVPMFDAGLADCLNHIGRTDDAIKLYQRALGKKSGYKTEFLNNLGVIYLNREQVELAEEMFRSAENLNDAEATYNLGWVLLKRGQVERAIEYFHKALIRQPELHPAARRLAWVFATSEEERYRDLASARKLLDEHYDLSTTQSAAVFDTDGVIRAAFGDFSGAIQSTNKALEIARGRAEPDTSYITDLQQRLATYELGKPWVGGLQP